MKEEKILLVCTCADPSHQLIFSYFPENGKDPSPDDDERIVLCEVLLNRDACLPVRIWNALKYILMPGRCRYGNFADIILGTEHIDSLRRIVNYLESDRCQDK